MNDQVRSRKISRDGNARTDGILIHYELIVIPAKSAIDSPIAEMDQILNEGGLLEVRPVTGECER